MNNDFLSGSYLYSYSNDFQTKLMTKSFVLTHRGAPNDLEYSRGGGGSLSTESV